MTMETTNEKPASMRFRYNGKILNWKTDMVQLPMADLLLINCRMMDTKIWKKMFAKKAQGVCCEICQTNCMQSKPSLDQHIAGKKHQHNIENIVEFRHKLIKSLPMDKPTPVIKTPAVTNQTTLTETVVPPAPDISVKVAPATPSFQKSVIAPSQFKKVAQAEATSEIPIKAAPPAPTFQKSVPATTISKKQTTATPQKSAAASVTSPQKPATVITPSSQKPGPAVKLTPQKLGPVATQTPQKSGLPATPAPQKPGPVATPTSQKSGLTATPTSQKSGSVLAPTLRKSVPVAAPTPQKTGPAATTLRKVSLAAASTPQKTGTTTAPIIQKPSPVAAASQKSGPVAAQISQKSGPAAAPTSQKSSSSTAHTPQKSDSPPALAIQKSEPSPASTPNKTEPVVPLITMKEEPIEIEIVDLLSDNEEESKIDEQPPLIANDSNKTAEHQPEIGVEMIESDKTLNTTNDLSTASSTDVLETSQLDATQINIPLAQKQIETLKNVIHSLGLTDLKQIQYRYVNTDWQNMIAEIQGEFTCVLCKKSKIPDLFSLKTHLGDQRHKNLFNSLRGLYHPIISPVKLPTRILVTKPPANENEGSGKGEEPVDLKALEREMSKEKIYWDKSIALEEFKLKHIYLDIQELLKVEYREKSNIWYSLIYKQGTTYKCALCKTPYLGNVKNITEHLRGRKHLTAANILTEMYHPKFCIAADRTMTGIDNRSSECSGMNDQSQERTPSKIDNKTGKENLVINPLAVMKSTTGSDSVKKTSISPHPGRNLASQMVTTKKNFPLNPGLQNKTQTNLPTFASKTFTTKPLSDKDLEGFVGVEYVVKILRNATDLTPRFECCLCETETDGYGMQAHLKSSVHRCKYLDRHFPTCMRQFQSFRNDTSARNILADIVRRIAIAIEKYHGRDLPFECLQDEFQTHRVSIMAKVFSFRHASEYSGPSMVNVIDKQILDNMIKNKNNYANPDLEPKRKPTFDAGDQISAKRYRRDDQPPPNVTGLGLDVEEHKKLVDQFLRNTNRDGLLDRTRRRSRSRDRRYNAGRSRRSRSRSMGRKRSRSGDGWASYKRMFDHAIRDLDTDYKRFERDPETHPFYQKEWKIFWQKRSEELANDGRDPTSYDFQPEWILFWTRRMDQLYDEEVDLLKRNLRDRLKLPYHNNDLRDERYHVGSRRKPVSAFSQILQTMNNNIPNAMNNMSGGMNDIPYNMLTNQMQSNMGSYGMQQQNMGQYAMQQNMPDMMGQNMPELMSQNMSDIMQHMQMQQNMMQLNMQQEISQSNQMHNMQPNQQIQQNMPLQQNITSFMDQNKVIEQQSQQQTQSQSKSRNIQQGSSSVDDERNRNQLMDSDDRDRDRDVGMRNRNARSIQPAAKQNKISRQEEEEQDLIEEPIETGPLTVVSVLRLLTALEDNLGILGPRVIDLLAKALTLEKVKPNSADRALLTEENCVFLETVREKLRGQIVVGVLDNSKTRAVNQAIKDVTALLNKGNQYEPPVTERMARDVFKNPTAPAAPIISQNDAGEKRELASKLATALAAQGKTNVSSEQLEQLIAVYSLIEKKQRENNVEQKKQSLSDLLVDFLKPGTSAASSESNNRKITNTSSNDNFKNISNRDNNFSTFRGQQRQQQHSMQQFSNPNNPNQYREKSNPGLSSQNPSFSNPSQINSYNFGLSNFDTSLSLPSLSNFNRNQTQAWSSSNNNVNNNNNREKDISNFDIMRNNSQNTPAFSTNLGRSSGIANKSSEMVSYPSVWQRGGGQQQSRNPAANNNPNINQQAPFGWQQNNNRNNNTRNQFRGRR